MKNFNDTKLIAVQSYNIFGNISKYAVICINKDNNQNQIIPQLNRIKCLTYDCSDDWKSKRKKVIYNTDICLDSCDNDTKYFYEYNGICYENCTNGFYLDDKGSKKCKCELEKCLICPPEALNKSLCIKCNKDYYQIENDSSNIEKYINCYKEPKGYYLDKNDSLYKKCYYTCEECEIKGDNITHNCLECNSNFSVKINFNNKTNCYKKCDYYYFIDIKNEYHCTLNNSCPNNYPVLIQDKMECIFKNIEIKDMIKIY